MKEKLFNMLAESTIFQGVITVLVIGGWVYLLAATGSAPDELTSAALLIIGFFFGGKFTQTAQRLTKNGPKG